LAATEEEVTPPRRSTTSAPVARFLWPDEFDAYRDNALTKSFLEAVSGPLVRSSYRAECMLERNNAGL